MITELTKLLSGRGLATNKECRNPVLSTGVTASIHQAIGVYMHWVILEID